MCAHTHTHTHTHMILEKFKCNSCVGQVSMFVLWRWANVHVHAKEVGKVYLLRRWANVYVLRRWANVYVLRRWANVYVHA